MYNASHTVDRSNPHHRGGGGVTPLTTAHADLEVFNHQHGDYAPHDHRDLGYSELAEEMRAMMSVTRPGDPIPGIVMDFLWIYHDEGIEMDGEVFVDTHEGVPQRTNEPKIVELTPPPEVEPPPQPQQQQKQLAPPPTAPTFYTIGGTPLPADTKFNLLFQVGGNYLFGPTVPYRTSPNGQLYAGVPSSKLGYSHVGPAAKGAVWNYLLQKFDGKYGILNAQTGTTMAEPEPEVPELTEITKPPEVNSAQLSDRLAKDNPEWIETNVRVRTGVYTTQSRYPNSNDKWENLGGGNWRFVFDPADPLPLTPEFPGYPWYEHDSADNYDNYSRWRESNRLGSRPDGLLPVDDFVYDMNNINLLRNPHLVGKKPVDSKIYLYHIEFEGLLDRPFVVSDRDIDVTKYTAGISLVDPRAGTSTLSRHEILKSNVFSGHSVDAAKINRKAESLLGSGSRSVTALYLTHKEDGTRITLLFIVQ